MTIGKHAASNEDLERQAVVARDGALNFVLWVRALVAAFCDASGHWFGDPIRKDQREPPQTPTS